MTCSFCRNRVDRPGPCPTCALAKTAFPPIFRAYQELLRTLALPAPKRRAVVVTSAVESTFMRERGA